MIKINLLSPQDKLHIKWEKINHSVVTTLINIIVIQIIFIILLVVSMQFLKMENDNTEKQLSMIKLSDETVEIKEILVDMRDYNDQLEFILDLQNNHMHWTSVLNKFSEIVPDGVRINSFNAKKYIEKSKTKKNTKVTDDKNYNKLVVDIIGKARARDDLLKLEDNIENSNIFYDLISDQSNYVKPINIEFKYTFFVDKKDLLTKNDL